jgi:hypothetical protein
MVLRTCGEVLLCKGGAGFTNCVIAGTIAMGISHCTRNATLSSLTTPAAGARTSRVTLSVSICAITSSADTASPGVWKRICRFLFTVCITVSI